MPENFMYHDFPFQIPAYNRSNHSWLEFSGEIGCMQEFALRSKMDKPNWVGRNQTSKLSLAERFWEKVNKSPDENGCWNWTAHTDHKGYGVLRVGEQMVHSNRVAWLVTYGEIPNGMFVCHTCDNRKCCNPTHLFLGTNNDNMKDMAKKGRSTRGRVFHKGETHPNAKLKDKQVMEIRRLYKTGKYTYLRLAHIYEVSFQHIGEIVKGYKRI